MHLLKSRFEIQGPVRSILTVVIIAIDIFHVIWPFARVQQRSVNKTGTRGIFQFIFRRSKYKRKSETTILNIIT